MISLISNPAYVYIIGIILLGCGLGGMMISTGVTQARWGAILFVGAVVILAWAVRAP